jgi:hypothetical protein
MTGLRSMASSESMRPAREKGGQSRIGRDAAAAQAGQDEIG